MYRITSEFGEVSSIRNFKPHTGIDFAMNQGEPLRSIQDGVIMKFGEFGNLGKGVFIRWNDGKTAIYGHLSEFANIQIGQYVKTGDLIGYAGSTGNSTGSHLHFAIKEGSNFIDPSPYIESIQYMNSQPIQQAITFFDLFQSHMSIFTELMQNVTFKFMNFLLSTDYFPFIQLIKNLTKLFLFNT